METRQQTLKLTSADGTALNARAWQPAAEAPARGQVLLVHGLAEHLDRYDHVARALTEAGWRVLGVELRGHGDSAGKRGHVAAWRAYVQDVEAALARAAAPCWLLGHSMGGLVALDLALSRVEAGGGDPPLLGLVLSNPLLGVAVVAPRWKTALAGLLSKLLPRLSLSNEVDPELISRDPRVVRAYRDDPRVFSTITPRWFSEMLAAIERVNGAAGRYDLPLLMLTSDHDGLCNTAAARAFLSRYGGQAQERRYPELYHELFNEPEKEQVLAEMLAWLEASAGKG
jgi:lysophospholipase